MVAAPQSAYYSSRTAKHLRGFDRFSTHLRRSLSPRYGPEFADEVIRDTRGEFERIIPELPYIGGRRNYFTPVIVANGWLVALYRVMKGRGKTVEDVIAVACEVTDRFFRSFPGRLLSLGGRAATSGLVKNILRKQAALSQKRRFPEDFVYEVRTDGEDDLALEFSECAVNKFYKAQNAEELGPYCNFFDVAYSRLMGMGLDAGETIGQGCEKCRLRYKRGRETLMPDRLKDLFPH